MRGQRALTGGRLWKRDGVWVLDYRSADGRRRRKSLSRDRRTAERIKSDIIRQRDLEVAGMGVEAGQDRLLSDLLDLYLADLRLRVSPLHFKYVSARLRRVVKQLGDMRIRQLNVTHVNRLRNEAVQNGKSNRTANLIADSLGAMLRWCEDADLIGRNPIGKVKRLPTTREHQRYRRRSMSENEIARFLAAAEADDDRCAELAALEGWTRVPQSPMWRLFLATGGRWNETRLATWGDLDTRERVLVLRAENTKSRKERAIPLHDDLLAPFLALKKIHARVLGRVPGPGDRILLSPEGSPWPRPTTNPMRIFDRVLAAAGIDKVEGCGEKLDMHALRTTFNTRLARGGVELSKRQALLGHSDPRLTANIYTRLNTDDLRDAIEALPPLSPVPDQQREAR